MSVRVGSVGLDSRIGTWHEVLAYVTPYVNQTYSKDIAILRVSKDCTLSEMELYSRLEKKKQMNN